MLSRFTCGDTLSITDSLTDYPASAGWVLKHRLVPDIAGTAIDLSSTASGDSHLTTAAAATTAAWGIGTYTWSSWAEQGSTSHSVANGKITLLTNPRTATSALDLRSDAQIALDNVRATIRGKATADVLRYEVAGRTLERYPMRELLALEARLAALVANEKRAVLLASGKPDPRRYTVRLGRA